MEVKLTSGQTSGYRIYPSSKLLQTRPMSMRLHSLRFKSCLFPPPPPKMCNITLIISQFSPECALNILNIQINEHVPKDTILWKPEHDGVFSVKSVYFFDQRSRFHWNVSGASFNWKKSFGLLRYKPASSFFYGNWQLKPYQREVKCFSYMTNCPRSSFYAPYARVSKKPLNTFSLVVPLPRSCSCMPSGL